MKDLISRQAVLNLLHALPPEEVTTKAILIQSVQQMNAAQPEVLACGEGELIAQPEIIQCKDCKHWDGVDTCDVIDAPVWDNDFCSMAERRSDE